MTTVDTGVPADQYSGQDLHSGRILLPRAVASQARASPTSIAHMHLPHCYPHTAGGITELEAQLGAQGAASLPGGKPSAMVLPTEAADSAEKLRSAVGQLAGHLNVPDSTERDDILGRLGSRRTHLQTQLGRDMLAKIAMACEGLQPALDNAVAREGETSRGIAAARDVLALAEGDSGFNATRIRGLQVQIAGLLTQRQTVQERVQLQTLVINTLESGCNAFVQQDVQPICSWLHGINIG